MLKGCRSVVWQLHSPSCSAHMRSCYTQQHVNTTSMSWCCTSRTQALRLSGACVKKLRELVNYSCILHTLLHVMLPMRCIDAVLLAAADE
jgi:hypothetical protein